MIFKNRTIKFLDIFNDGKNIFDELLSIKDINFNNRGNRVALQLDNGLIKVLDIGENKQEVAIINCPHLKLYLSASGKYLVLSDSYGTLRIIDLDNKCKVIYKTYGKFILFSPDENYFCVMQSLNTNAKLFCIHEGCKEILSIPFIYKKLLFDNNSKYLISIFSNNLITIYDFVHGKEILSVKSRKNVEIEFYQSGLDSRFFAVKYSDENLLIFDLENAGEKIVDIDINKKVSRGFFVKRFLNLHCNDGTQMFIDILTFKKSKKISRPLTLSSNTNTNTYTNQTKKRKRADSDTNPNKRQKV